MLGGWRLPFESGGTKNEVPRLIAVAGLFFLFCGQKLELEGHQGTVGKLRIRSFVLSIQKHTILMRRILF